MYNADTFLQTSLTHCTCKCWYI